jgi:hypothetical protein
MEANHPFPSKKNVFAKDFTTPAKTSDTQKSLIVVTHVELNRT